MNADITRVLTTSIDLLPLSENFKQLTMKKGYHTLDEIMNMPLTKLATLKWFSDTMLAELGEFIYDLRHKKNEGN